ncbi:hypothetical protein U729_3217 (plasmid) [Clostridium baratii str. Sullivan]|uniref:Uncharacterized protein n=2 Tax=Clostridium baratii TaxID=1561 RepID=A0A0A7G089_9CLOT|nr:hypothetical protein U729_3217 [Clostridium baratii str. Sullivan]
MYLRKIKNVKTDEKLLSILEDVGGVFSVAYYLNKLKIYHNFKDKPEEIKKREDDFLFAWDYENGEKLANSLKSFEAFLNENYGLNDCEDVDKRNKLKKDAEKEYKALKLIYDNIENGNYDNINFEEVKYWRKHSDLHGYMESNVLFPKGLESCDTVILDKQFFETLLEKVKKDMPHHLNYAKFEEELTNEFKKDNKIIEKDIGPFVTKEFIGSSENEYNDRLNELEEKYNKENNVVLNIPKATGFFWGESLIEDWESTIETCIKVLNEVDFDKDIVYYYASW